MAPSAAFASGLPSFPPVRQKYSVQNNSGRTTILAPLECTGDSLDRLVEVLAKIAVTTHLNQPNDHRLRILLPLCFGGLRLACRYRYGRSG